MSVGRRIILFLSLLVLAVCSASMLAGPAVWEYASVLRYGWGRQPYEAAAVGTDGLAAAAGWDGGALRLRLFDLEGRAVGSWAVDLPQEAGGTIASLYPCRENLVYLGVYSPDATTLSVYRLTRAGGAELLLEQECRGASAAARRDGTRLSVFSQDGNTASFVVLSDGYATGYTCPVADGGLVELGSQPLGGARTAAVLPDGSLILGGPGALTVDGQQNPGVTASQLPARLTRRGVGLYYIDGADLGVYYSDLTNAHVRRVLSLQEAAAGHRVSSVSLTADGRALLLLDGHTLLLAGEEGSTLLEELLYPTAAHCALMLALLVLAAAAAAALVWYLLCGRRRCWAPMALQWGCLLAALALAGALGLRYGVELPAQSRQAEEERFRVVDGVLQAAQADRGYQPLTGLDSLSAAGTLADEQLPGTLSAALGGIYGGAYRDVTVTAAYLQDGLWRLPDGSLAALDSAFDPALAEAAAAGPARSQSGDVFRCCFRQGDWALTVALRQDAAPAAFAAGWWLLAVAALAIVILLAVGRDVRRLTAATAGLLNGEGRLRLATGDELAGMATTLSSTADALDAQSRARDDLERAYRRFVPEQLLTLLGKQSIQQVDKSTFVSRRMAVMQVHFAFPEPLYTQQANSRLLFDSVNQVIERTSNLATRNGGTVFHFSYDGYDVVMENDSRKVISTAVAIQQEVLAFNEGRVREGMPTVRFHIALDVGDVLLGVVGDSARMEPTTISTSFSVVRELVGLSGRLEARILCTESVIDGAGEYGSRYLGKCWLDDEAIRVYEIFDGDDYSVRKSKSQTVGRFSQGVYALYSGETAQAKRIFLELVHNDPADGGARYYLYLADRMERDPELVCGLNPRRAEQRRN